MDLAERGQRFGAVSLQRVALAAFLGGLMLAGCANPDYAPVPLPPPPPNTLSVPPPPPEPVAAMPMPEPEQLPPPKHPRKAHKKAHRARHGKSTHAMPAAPAVEAAPVTEAAPVVSVPAASPPAKRHAHRKAKPVAPIVPEPAAPPPVLSYPAQNEDAPAAPAAPPSPITAPAPEPVAAVPAAPTEAMPSSNSDEARAPKIVLVPADGGAAPKPAEATAPAAAPAALAVPAEPAVAASGVGYTFKHDGLLLTRPTVDAPPVQPVPAGTAAHSVGDSISNADGEWRYVEAAGARGWILASELKASP